LRKLHRGHFINTHQRLQMAHKHHQACFLPWGLVIVRLRVLRQRKSAGICRI
jgi:hypothetical protein